LRGLACAGVVEEGKAMAGHPARSGDGAARKAFTLVELLVVIAIVGVLISMLLPAIQSAREAARRLSCKNNFRQIGIGMHNYHDALNSFPPGGLEPRSPRWPNGRQLAWSLLLLPFIEEEPLYKSVKTGLAFDAPENEKAAATILPVYICPSVPHRSYLSSGRGICDYGGIYGPRPPVAAAPNNPPRGTMLYDKAIRIKDISDGTSKTLLISEDCDFADGQWINGLNVFDVAFPINLAPPYENDIRSKHAGGANALFADGSVHFLAEIMTNETLSALCTRAGSDVVGEY
jgi:prepilin-type N-terminal cleavage/methylation domain-containing protein/prepilin-type processing-associated H-X9-DG protein